MDELESEDIFHYPITGEIDLHTFQPSETKSAVNEYLHACKQKGFKTVRIVHGKGKSVQKSIVHSLLQKHPLVREYHDAPPVSGGWGATVVYLK